MRAQRSGERSTRRSDGKPLSLEEARGDAVGGDHEVLDQLLGAVALSRGAGRSPRRRRTPRAAPASPGPARRAGAAARRSACATRSCRRRLSASPATAASLGGAAARAVEPGRDAVVGELGVVDDDARDRARPSRDLPVASTIISITIARRSCPSFSEVRSVDSSSGSIGKISRGGVDRRRVGARVVVERRVPAAPCASTSAIATRILVAPAGSASATDS